MKKTNKIITFLVIIIILINIGAYFYIKANTPISEERKNEIELARCIQNEDKECLYLLAIKTNNVSICGIYDHPGYKPTCLKYFAIAKNNPKYCEEVIKISDHTDCYIYLALYNKDISLCGKDNTNRYSKEDCIETIEKDYATCNETLKEPCFYTAIINRYTPMCKKLNKEDAIVCLTLLTRSTKLCLESNIFPQEKKEIVCLALATRDSSGGCEDIYNCEDSINDLTFLTNLKKFDQTII